MDAGTWGCLPGRSHDNDVSRLDSGGRSDVDVEVVDRRWRLVPTRFDVPDNSGEIPRRGWPIDSQPSCPPSPSSTCDGVTKNTTKNAFSIRRHFLLFVCFNNYVTFLLQFICRQFETILGNFMSPLRYSTFPYPVRSGDVTSRRSSPSKVVLCSSPFLYLLVKLIFFVAVATSSQNGVAMAAAASARASPSSSVRRIFDGDPGEEKNFDWTGYLMQYGYLPESDLESGALRSEDELRRSIRQFQRIAGLAQTGRFDQNTVEVMKKPRCGMADLLTAGRWTANDEEDGGAEQHQHQQHSGGPEEIRTSSNGGHHQHPWKPQQYAFGPSKWNRTQLTFRIVEFATNMSISETRGAIHRALRIWQDASRLTFHEVQTGYADIMFNFAKRYHGDGYPFDGPGMVLAHAFFPGEDRGGDVHFDDEESWTVYTEHGVDLFMVATHELGHALGLAHSNEPDSLMFPWHQGYSDDFKLHRDDVEAIQQLYGAPGGSHDPRRPTPHRPTQAPTRLPPTTTTVRTPRVPPTRRTTHGHVVVEPFDGAEPDACQTDFDAVSMIRGEIFAFKGKWFWRITDSGVMNGHPVEISRFWYGLPTDLDRIDAVYERSSDGHIVFFSGRKYWSFTGSERYPTAGRPLTDFGLPEDIDHIDAAFVWGHNHRTYIISSGMYWKLGYEEHSALSPVEMHGYPRDMSLWAGVPLPVDSVFTHTDGRTYFFKGHQYWEFNNARMHVQRGHPRLIGPRWLNCSRTETPNEKDGTGRSDYPKNSASAIHSVLTTWPSLLQLFIVYMSIVVYECLIQRTI